MFINRKLKPAFIIYFSWRTVLFSTLLSAAVVLLHVIGVKFIEIPFLPIATVGTAVAFYVGFKNNSSYDRLWEGRKIWGEIVNLSRSSASYLLSVTRCERGKDLSAAQLSGVRAFVMRQIAFVNLLRLQLRRRNMWETHIYTQLARDCFAQRPFELQAHECLNKYVSEEEANSLMTSRNVAKELLHRQMSELTNLKRQGAIDAYEHSDLMRLCTELFSQQGKAERIKTFPFPRQYAFFSEVFVNIFVCLVPFGLIGEFSKLDGGHEWLTIPFSVLIAWVFDTMEKVGDTSENPFENGINDVPMSAICINIEIDLLEMLGETELPEPLKAECDVLM